MIKRKYRVLLIASHPVQYAAPIFRRMAQHPRLDILVAYCSLQGATPGLDAGFGREVAWDIPLLEGYPWLQLKNISPQPGLGHFFGLINPGLGRLILKENFDAVVAYTGYAYLSFWLAAAGAKLKQTPLLFGTDSHDVSPRDKQTWKVRLKKSVLPYIFRLADAVIVPSTGGVKFMRALGIPEQRVHLTPYVVNNDWWLEQAAQVDRAKVRRQWQIPAEAPVVLFCAKLQPWKRPQDILHAFARIHVLGTYLVFAGDGPLQTELEAAAQALHVFERVRFLGFVNQSQLPAVYRASDLFVLPSEYEPFGVVVNEAMLCGCPVVVSDQVGARYDLVRDGETGRVYPSQDINALVEILQNLLVNPENLKQMGKKAHKRMETWSPRENINSFIQAIERSVKDQEHIVLPQ
jgi:glycosyltransferase involved in cell wall biosynthesis